MMYYSIEFTVDDEQNATFSTVVKANNPEEASDTLIEYWIKMGKIITINSIKVYHFLGYKHD